MQVIEASRWQQLRLVLGREEGIGHCEKTQGVKNDTAEKLMKWPQLRLKLEGEVAPWFASQHQMRKRRSPMSSS